LKTCSLYVSAFVSISSCESGLRVTLRPVGSPISAVESPIRKMTVCPSCWKCAACGSARWSQMQVRRGGIEPRLDAHGHARRPRLRDALAQRSSGMISAAPFVIRSTARQPPQNVGISSSIRPTLLVRINQTLSQIIRQVYGATLLDLKLDNVSQIKDNSVRCYFLIGIGEILGE